MTYYNYLNKHIFRNLLLREDAFLDKFFVTAFLFLFCSYSVTLGGYYVKETYITKEIQISGNSMYPTLDDGETYDLDMLTAPERFDIIVFKHDAKTSYIKRLIGLPGDTVSVEEGVLYINGVAQKEPYLEETKFKDAYERHYKEVYTSDFTLDDITDSKHKKIPEGYYLVLGDNRPISYDSRGYGLIKKEQITGHLSDFSAKETYHELRSAQDIREHTLEEQ